MYTFYLVMVNTVMGYVVCVRVNTRNDKTWRSIQLMMCDGKLRWMTCWNDRIQIEVRSIS